MGEGAMLRTGCTGGSNPSREGFGGSYRYLASILESMLDAVIVVKPGGAIHTVNRAALELLGYAEEEIIGQSVGTIFEDDDLKDAGLAQLVHAGAVRDVELTLVAKSGERIPVVFNGSVIWEEDGRLAAVVGVARDIRERKRAEEELQRTMEKLREALGGIIQTVALTVETKDPYTAGHQRRVAQLACAIANEMDLPEEQIEGLRMAGLIHDLGKITVPAEILSKPGRLDDIEYGLIKAHPKIGYDVLKTIDFPWPVAQIVLQHHERTNASGYPQGLRGEEILLEARILAVADVVEAMASFRPYRPARGIDEALEEISRKEKRLYDLDVVAACLQIFTVKGFKFDQ
jgi:PAS domain S-box-containing protein